MLQKLVINYLSNLVEIHTLSTGKLNKIVKADEKGFYVETKASREKYDAGEKTEPYEIIPISLVDEAWEILIQKRLVSAEDLNSGRGRSSFLLALLSNLPFVDKIKKNGKMAIGLKEYLTSDLPETKLPLVKDLLAKVINGTVLLKTLSKQIEEENLNDQYKRARPGLKILKIIDDDFNVLNEVLDDYIKSTNKNEFLRKKILENPIFSVIYTLLSVPSTMDKKEKKNAVKELGMLVVRNSKGENFMVESVADDRIRNTLSWLQEVGLIDEKLNSCGENRIMNNKENVSDQQLVDHIYEYIQNKGFYYEKEEVTNLFLSLKTKPFVILSGISGTGKTMMAKWFAESLGATKENGQFSLIPVRPDWSDGSDLLGYRDIKGEFIQGPLTKVLEDAQNNIEKPYFVLLDEMNLARVEYYFSDFLSVMESREWDNGKLITHSVLPEEIMGKKLGIPENVFIIGTVNMDETTFPFSKKVLDRANTIEFNRVALNHFAFLEANEEITPLIISNENIVGRFLHLKDAYSKNKELIQAVTNELVTINTFLEKIGAHVGYRVRDEICFYMVYNKKGDLLEFNEAFDYQILQKILPRLSGSDHRIYSVLKELYTYCTGKKINEEQIDNLSLELGQAKFPKSAQKLVDMLRRYNDNGFTSFWNGG